MQKPRVFISSSAESRAVAEAAQAILEPDVECTVWHQGLVELSATFLESVTAKLADFDAAVLVFTPDDQTTSRGAMMPVVRDNVIFEAGLFVGALGRDRVYILKADGDLHLPTDLVGTTVASYDHQRLMRTQPVLDHAAIGAPCTKIKQAILKIHERARMSAATDPLVFLQRAGLTVADVRAFYDQTGLTHAYQKREEAKPAILQDIAAAHHLVAMYARVYIDEVLKDAESFCAALAQAATTMPLDRDLVVVHTSTSPDDLALAESAWRNEDPTAVEWSSIEDYQRHLRRSDHHFDRRYEDVEVHLAKIPHQKRKRVRFVRRYLMQSLPYSLVVVDERVIYVSFYSMSKSRFGTFAPTMRFVIDSVNDDTWAKYFIREHDDLASRASRIGRTYPVL